MKKVICYVVTITEFEGTLEVSCRESVFSDLRYARSYYHTCVDFYLGFCQLSGISHNVDVTLSKKYKDNEIEIIDTYGKKF